jgi:hypothetical protein
MLPVTDRDRALSAVQGASSRFASLLGDVTDASVTAIGRWSIGETGAHVDHLAELFVKMARGEPSSVPDHLRLDEEWERLLATDRERDPTMLARRVEEHTSEFVEAAGTGDWRRIVRWHGGRDVPLYALASLLINECDVHGLDVASAVGSPWSFPPSDAALVVTGLFAVLPYYFDADAAGDLRATFALHVRGGPTVYATVSDGGLEITDARPSRVDCHISADPVEYVLVGYGRKSQWGPVPRGKIVAYGRKPWMAPRFVKLFHKV